MNIYKIPDKTVYSENIYIFMYIYNNHFIYVNIIFTVKYNFQVLMTTKE